MQLIYSTQSPLSSKIGNGFWADRLVLRLMQRTKSGVCLHGQATVPQYNFHQRNIRAAVAKAVDGAEVYMGVYSQASEYKLRSSYSHMYVLIHAR